MYKARTMRTMLGILIVGLFAVACGPSRDNYDPDGGDDGPPPGCVGLECNIVNCAKKGLPPTTISGTVYAPNGTLALYGATVYVPNVDPGPFVDGVACSRCEDQLPGDPVVQGISDTSGKFSISDVPAGTDIPLFITIGKWRRKVTIPAVVKCQDNQLPNTITSLPKNKTEGDLPKIAMVTGGCDKLECLVRRLGISDSEFTSETGGGRIHLFTGQGGTPKLTNGTMLATAASLWGDVNKLKNYDILMHSCECSEYTVNKTQAMMDNVKAYADVGGRVFLSHFHSVWIDGETDNDPPQKPAVWTEVAQCDISGTKSGTGVIDQVNNPKGSSFAVWLTNVMASATPGTIAITESKQSCSSIDPLRTERWVFMPLVDSATGQTIDYPQNFQFTTPNEAAKEARCGKVVFSDMHVAADSGGTTGFPGTCSAGVLSPQEKALAFMFFDVASCVGTIL